MALATWMMAGACVADEGGTADGHEPAAHLAGGAATLDGDPAGLGVGPGATQVPAWDVEPWQVTTQLPPGTCAPALPDRWSGTSLIAWGSPGAHYRLAADVTWTRLETIGCRDRYVPAGTLTYDRGHSAACSPPAQSGPIDHDDGELIIDRSTEPPTYTMRGETVIPYSQACDGAQPGPYVLEGGVWARQEGVVSGRTIGGARVRSSSTIIDHRWQFVATGATFDACAEPPADRWLSATEAGADVPTTWVTWERVSTVGCVDTYQPIDGTVEVVSTACELSPSAAPIAHGDGRLVIDRGASPPTFRVTGATSWEVVATCGSTGETPTTYRWRQGATWAWAEGSFDGRAFAGKLRIAHDQSLPGTGPRFSWRFRQP